MKMQHFRQSQHYLNTALKKISFLFILLLISAQGFSLEQKISIIRHSDSISLDFSAAEVDKDFFTETLKKDLRCGIVFKIQLYENRKANADKFILSAIISREGKWDPFTKSYVITENDDFLQYAESIEEFLEIFLKLKNYNIYFEKTPKSDYYILYRIKLAKVILVPPFQILAPGLSENFPSTPWVKYYFD